jgi:hypothetical protein
VGCNLYDADQPNQQQGQASQHALRALHDRGVLHFASSSRSTAVDLQQAEELELAGLFADKVCPLSTSPTSHHVCMMQHQPCA